MALRGFHVQSRQQICTTNLRHKRRQPVLLQTDLLDTLSQTKHGVGRFDAVLGFRHELQLSGSVLGVQLLEVDSGAVQQLLCVVEETFELGEQLRAADFGVDRAAEDRLVVGAPEDGAFRLEGGVEAQAVVAESTELTPGKVAWTGRLRCSVAVGRHPGHLAEELADSVPAAGRPRQTAQRRRLGQHASVAVPHVTDLLHVQRFGSNRAPHYTCTYSPPTSRTSSTSTGSDSTVTPENPTGNS